MNEKAAALPHSDPPDLSEFSELDAEHITLARALEDARAARESSLEIKREIMSELERFRAAVRSELKERRRKLDLHDVLLLIGLAAVSGGVAVALHWAYSLIIVGTVLMSLSVLPLFKTPIKMPGD